MLHLLFGRDHASSRSALGKGRGKKETILLSFFRDPVEAASHHIFLLSSLQPSSISSSGPFAS